MKKAISTVMIGLIAFSFLVGCSNTITSILTTSGSKAPMITSSSSPQSSPKQMESPSLTEYAPTKILSLQEQKGWALDTKNLLFTNNAGNSWSSILPTGISPQDILIDASFTNNAIGFAFYVTKDDTPTLRIAHQMTDSISNITEWEITNLPDPETWEASNLVKPYLYLADNDMIHQTLLLTSEPALGMMMKSIYQSSNNGKSWDKVADISNQVTGYPNGIAFRAPKEGWITTTYHGQDFIPFYRTKDGGTTWEVQPLTAPDEFKGAYANTYNVIFDEENDQHGVVTLEFVQDDQKTNVPYETVDGGKTWNPSPYVLRDLQQPPVFYFNNLIEGRAISLDGSSLYTISTYDKTNWTTVKPNVSLEQTSQLNMQNNGSGWVFSKGQLMITSDGGATWTKP